MYLRVLDDGARPPAENMAIDEALLRGGGLPSLRLYGWQPHAVSLGYFQKVDDFADLPIDTVIVRRSTGGGAIHHGDEITFALTLDANLLPKDLDQSYVLLHDAVRAALSTSACTALARRPVRHAEHGPTCAGALPQRAAMTWSTRTAASWSARHNADCATSTPACCITARSSCTNLH